MRTPRCYGGSSGSGRCNNTLNTIPEIQTQAQSPAASCGCSNWKCRCNVDNRRCKLEHTLIVKSAVSRAGARTWATSSDCNYRASVTLAGARTALARSAPGWEPRPGPGWSRSHRRDLAWPALIEPSNISHARSKLQLWESYIEQLSSYTFIGVNSLAMRDQFKFYIIYLQISISSY